MHKSNTAVGERNDDSLNVIKKICKLLRRFIQLNHNIKLPLFQSLWVSYVQNIYGKYFMFHINHIDTKDELIKHCEIPTTKGVN